MHLFVLGLVVSFAWSPPTMYYDSFYCIGGQNITFNQMHTARSLKLFFSQTAHLFVRTKFKINYFFITYTQLLSIFKSVIAVFTVGLSIFTFVLRVFFCIFS